MAKEPDTPGKGSATGFTGPLGKLKNIAVTVLSMLQTRLALLGNEIQMEKRLITQQLGLGLAVQPCWVASGLYPLFERAPALPVSGAAAAPVLLKPKGEWRWTRRGLFF